MLKIVKKDEESVGLKKLDIEGLITRLPKKPRDYRGDVKGFIDSEYSFLDSHNRGVLAIIHLHICNLRRKDLSPNKTIARPGKTRRLIRGLVR